MHAKVALLFLGLKEIPVKYLMTAPHGTTWKGDNDEYKK